MTNICMLLHWHQCAASPAAAAEGAAAATSFAICSDPSSGWQDMMLQMQGSIIINGKKWDSSVESS
eukprot:scaffold2510_cov169-Amphora_coffeaeformis.AAC.1